MTPLHEKLLRKVNQILGLEVCDEEPEFSYSFNNYVTLPIIYFTEVHHSPLPKVTLLLGNGISATIVDQKKKQESTKVVIKYKLRVSRKHKKTYKAYHRLREALEQQILARVETIGGKQYYDTNTTLFGAKIFRKM